DEAAGAPTEAGAPGAAPVGDAAAGAGRFNTERSMAPGRENGCCVMAPILTDPPNGAHPGATLLSLPTPGRHLGHTGEVTLPAGVLAQPAQVLTAPTSTRHLAARAVGFGAFYLLGAWLSIG